MKGSGTAFTTDEIATFGTNEAPARVDVKNDLFLLGRCVMFRARNLDLLIRKSICALPAVKTLMALDN